MSQAPVPVPPAIPGFTDGQPLNASVLQSPISALAQQLASLQQTVAQALIGTVVVQNNVPIVSGTLVGMAVYKLPTGVYAPGLAQMVTDQYGNAYGISTASLIEGVVYSLDSPTQGSVVNFGTIVLTAAQMSAACVGGAPLTGQLFLSPTPTTSGQLTATAPPLGVPVAISSGPDANGDYTLFVNPAPVNGMEAHIHYRVPLLAAPAGPIACVANSDPQYIETPDPTMEGWLPANSSVFSSLAPVGAQFGYNIAKNAELSRLWPPLPVGAVYMDRNGTGIATDGDIPLCQIDTNGIWWMSNCYGSTPWPETWPCGTSSYNPSFSSSCPWPVDDHFDLWFARLTTKTSEAMVESLTAANDSITITNSLGAPANSGALVIGANIAVALNTTVNTPGALPIKSFTGQTANTGLVVEGIISGSSAITVSGTPIPDNSGFMAGRVTVVYDDPNATRDGPLGEIELDNINLQTYQNVLFYEFPPTVESEIRGSVRLPISGINPNSSMQLRIMFLSEGIAGSLPEFTLGYRQMPMSSSSCNFLPLITTDSSLGVVNPGACGTVPVGSYTYVELESAAITVNPGDWLNFTVTRNGPDTYSGPVGILDIRWQII